MSDESRQYTSIYEIKHIRGNKSNMKVHIKSKQSILLYKVISSFNL